MHLNLKSALPAILVSSILFCDAAVAKTCRVVDGVIAEVAPGPLMPSAETVTLKAAYTAEFRWDIMDKEAIGWWRISDAEGREIGWLPSGHEGVACGDGN